jgi:hypothetical protein
MFGRNQLTICRVGELNSEYGGNIFTNTRRHIPEYGIVPSYNRRTLDVTSITVFEKSCFFIPVDRSLACKCVGNFEIVPVEDKHRIVTDYMKVDVKVDMFCVHCITYRRYRKVR